MTDNTLLNAEDELREELRELTEDIYREEHYDEIMRVILADRKKHIEAVLDRLESQVRRADDCTEDTLVVKAIRIEAERNKLNEAEL